MLRLVLPSILLPGFAAAHAGHGAGAGHIHVAENAVVDPVVIGAGLVAAIAAIALGAALNRVRTRARMKR